jgi:HEAT repeat protein
MSSLKEYAERLASSDEVDRLYAAEDIGCLNSPDGVAPLVDRLVDEPSSSVRTAIFQSLIRMDGDAPIVGAVTLLASDSPVIRNQAVDILRRKGPATIPFLLPVMQNGDKDLRKLALDVVAHLPSNCAHDLYAAALNDPDPNVVITAVENLGRLGAEEFRAQIEGLLESAQHPMLIAACLEALAGIANPVSLASIKRRFPHISVLPDYLLVPCLRAIGAVGTAPDLEEVGALLSFNRSSLQSAVLGAMMATCSRGMVPAPTEELLQALRKIVVAGSVAPCRYEATRLLGLWSLRDDVCTFLIESLESPEPLVRLGAAESLSQSGRRGLGPELAAKALEEFNREDPPATR